MTQSEHRKIDWTPEDRARHGAIREKFQREKPSAAEFSATGEYVGPIPLAAYQAYHLFISELKKAREAAEWGLSEFSERCGIDEAVLSRLETGLTANPTIETLIRYATALGKVVKLNVEDFDPASSTFILQEATDRIPQTAGT